MAKILKCSGNEDMITLKTDDDSDSLTFMFESPSQDRISDFELRLMAIDSEHLGIPDTEYTATIKMPSSEFQRITRDLQIVGDTVKISCTKDGVKFSVVGDLVSGNTMIRQSQNVEKPEEAVVIDLEEPVSQSFAMVSDFPRAITQALCSFQLVEPCCPAGLPRPILQSDSTFQHCDIEAARGEPSRS